MSWSTTSPARWDSFPSQEIEVIHESRFYSENFFSTKLGAFARYRSPCKFAVCGYSKTSLGSHFAFRCKSNSQRAFFFFLHRINSWCAEVQPYHFGSFPELYIFGRVRDYLRYGLLRYIKDSLKLVKLIEIRMDYRKFDSDCNCPFAAKVCSQSTLITRKHHT